MALSDELKMKKNFKSKKNEALLNILKTANIIQKRANSFFSAYGLSDAQYNLLIVLNQAKDGLSQVEIGERVVASRANITALIDRLEEKRYVKRFSVLADRRVFKVCIEKAGKDLIKKIEKKYFFELETLMRNFNDSECKKISEMMVKLRSNALSKQTKK